jgi:hypothetical protein
MPPLKEDITASTVDCSGDSLPAFDLLGGMDAGQPKGTHPFPTFV